MSADNVVTVTFNEPVKFADYDTMESNMKTNIDGPKSPYSYSFSIANKDSLVANQTFTKLQIAITSLTTTIYGNDREKIQIWWTDLSVITDEAGNSLSSGKIEGNLNVFEYLPPAVEKATRSTGQSIKFSILSLFSMNILLKLFISTSAGIMWSLIHVLQAFRYILMLNINMPKIIDVLMEYMAIVIGELDEVDNLTPDVLNTYLLNSSDINDQMFIRANFQKYGYDTPYLTDLYGRKIFMAL